MHEALEGLQDVYCIADDTVVVGQGDTKKEAGKNNDLKCPSPNKLCPGKEPKVQPAENPIQVVKDHLPGTWAT